MPANMVREIHQRAYELVTQIRKDRVGKGGLDAFLFQYDLSSEEGIALMCLAEALLRIPDKQTVDDLIRDKISQANWDSHRGQSSSFFVNGATWALMLTGRILGPESADSNYLNQTLKKLVTRSGEPIIRNAVLQAIRILSRQFVMGRSIEEAIKRAKTLEGKGYRYSYDMLGEAAYTDEDALRYFESYQKAIQSIATSQKQLDPIQGPGISVKLSALHPRYEMANRERVLSELLPRLKVLVRQAKDANINFTIDAEESERLEISLELIEAIVKDPEFSGWKGFGLAVQAYQKRAVAVVDWLISIARTHQQTLMIRLVKGAYWDTEIKNAQVEGLSGYPVFTRKITTDVSYIACAKRLLDARDIIYPQFATHNAHTVSTIMTYSENLEGFEFQCLHGMGEALYEQIVANEDHPIPARIYAPVGTHEDLLAYLVRRLLENGANSSFVNRIVDERLPIEEIIACPVAKLERTDNKPHPCIPLPVALFGDERANSMGLNLANPSETQPILEKLSDSLSEQWHAKPTHGKGSDPTPIISPIDKTTVVGTVSEGDKETVDEALSRASNAQKAWQNTPLNERAACLSKVSDLLEAHQDECLKLLVHEAGKTLLDAINEVREAVDFCRYYAQEGLSVLAPKHLPGPTGECNTLLMEGRGIIACISPWNFPLAIFMGQVVAALMTGNAVIAKPAEQTPLIAQRAVDWLHEAGVPADVVQLLPGQGESVGSALIHDLRVNGVMFTGSTEVAQIINQTLATRGGPIVPLIAETGGQNALLVDSTALPEQVTQDVIQSAFLSAGQRCSALRVLFVQEEVAERTIRMIKGAMQELKVGDPRRLETDIGPVIDGHAREMLLQHQDKMKRSAQNSHQTPQSQSIEGHYVYPSLHEISSLEALEREVFGPILHVVRFSIKELESVVDSINATGYGLTLGIHSRVRETVDRVVARAKVGNVYVNRNITGAVVGVQPFGGEGLSGTGPKAGGPHYLLRLCQEKTVSINTTAAGGNASLMSLTEA